MNDGAVGPALGPDVIVRVIGHERDGEVVDSSRTEQSYDLALRGRRVRHVRHDVGGQHDVEPASWKGRPFEVRVPDSAHVLVQPVLGREVPGALEVSGQVTEARGGRSRSKLSQKTSVPWFRRRR